LAKGAQLNALGGFTLSSAKRLSNSDALRSDVLLLFSMNK
jgi:hypothetical protein